MAGPYHWYSQTTNAWTKISTQQDELEKESLEIQHLRCFCATATSFSMTKAAEQLQMTQSNVSHHVAALEARFKTSLFDRDATGMRLTKAGKKLLPHALNIMEELNEIDRKLGGER